MAAPTTTTLSTKVLTGDIAINVASVTNISVGKHIRIDNEIMRVAQSWGTSAYPSSGTLVPVVRGLDGTATAAHPVTANVVMMVAATDAMLPPIGEEFAVINPAAPCINILSYTAAGALTLGGQGTVGPQAFHIINGTNALAMTVAAPDTSMDGMLLVVMSNGKAAHTLAVSGNNGVGNAGAGYRTLTWAAGAKIAMMLIACNGDWLPLGVYGGTTTNIQVALS